MCDILVYQCFNCLLSCEDRYSVSHVWHNFKAQNILNIGGLILGIFLNSAQLRFGKHFTMDNIVIYYSS